MPNASSSYVCTPPARYTTENEEVGLPPTALDGPTVTWEEYSALRNKVIHLEQTIEMVLGRLTDLSATEKQRAADAPGSGRRKRPRTPSLTSSTSTSTTTPRSMETQNPSSTTAQKDPTCQPSAAVPPETTQAKSQGSQQRTPSKGTSSNETDKRDPASLHAAAAAAVVAAPPPPRSPSNEEETLQPSPGRKSHGGDGVGGEEDSRVAPSVHRRRSPSRDKHGVLHPPCSSKYHDRFAGPEKHGSSTCPFCSVCHILETVFNGNVTKCAYKAHHMTPERVQKILKNTGFLTAGMRRAHQLLSGARIGIALLQGTDAPVVNMH